MPLTRNTGDSIPGYGIAGESFRFTLRDMDNNSSECALIDREELAQSLENIAKQLRSFNQLTQSYEHPHVKISLKFRNGSHWTIIQEPTC